MNAFKNIKTKYQKQVWIAVGFVFHVSSGEGGLTHFENNIHMWLMIGQKTAKCDMRVLRVPVTWFFVVFFLNSSTKSLWHAWHAWHEICGLIIWPMWPTWHVWHAWHAYWVSESCMSRMSRMSRDIRDMRDIQISDSLDPCDPRDMCDMRDMRIEYQ